MSDINQEVNEVNDTLTEVKVTQPVETTEPNPLEGVDLQTMAASLDPYKAVEDYLANLVVDGLVPNVIEDEEMNAEIRALVLNAEGITEVVVDEASDSTKQKYDPETDKIFWLVVGEDRFSAVQSKNGLEMKQIDEIMTEVCTNKQIVEQDLAEYIRHFLLAIATGDKHLLKEENVKKFTTKAEAVNKLLVKCDTSLKMLFTSIMEFGDIEIPTWDKATIVPQGEEFSTMWGFSADVSKEEVTAKDRMVVMFVKLIDQEGNLTDKYHPIVRRYDNQQRPTTFARANIKQVVEEHFTTEEFGASIAVEFDSLKFKVSDIELYIKDGVNLETDVV